MNMYHIKTGGKRLLCLVMAVIMVLLLIPVFPASAVIANGEYSENIQSIIPNWSSDVQWPWFFDETAGTVTAPAVAAKPLYLHKDFSDNLKNYTFEAQITLSDNTATLGGICFGVQDQDSVISRYEFSVSYYNGGWCPRIYKRVAGVDGFSGYNCNGGHQTVDKNISITPGVPFTMKIVVSGLWMRAYINGSLVLSDRVSYSENDASYAKGAIYGGVGLLGFNNATAAFDNVKLYSSNTMLFEDDFSNVGTEHYSGTVIWQDDFSQSGATWENGTFAENGIRYDFSIANGVASVTAPTTNSVDVPMSVSLTRPESELLQENYYCVEANVGITGDSKTPTLRKGAAGIQFAKDTESGEIYELRLTSTGKVHVYRGNAQLKEWDLAAVTGTSFQYGSSYKLCAYVYDDVMLLTVNNYSLGYLTGLDNASGYSGIQAVSGSAFFDDFVTGSMNRPQDNNLIGIRIYGLENGALVGTEPQYRFDAQSHILLAKYMDGTTIPISLSKATISGYNPESIQEQKVTITYSAKTCTIVYLPGLFRDNFTGNLSDRWNAVGADNLTYAVQKNALSFQVSDKASVFWDVADSTGWTNYSVSADVRFDSQSGSMTRYFSLTGRYTSKSWYEFRLVYGNGMTAVLARFDNGTYVPLQTYTNTQLRACTGFNGSITMGKWYNVELSMTGNLLQVYFNGELLGSYRDTSDNALTQGSAGMRIINNNCTIDNYEVMERGDGTIESFGLSQFPNGDITLWQGNGIEIWNNDLIVNYADGTSEAVPLKREMLDFFDSTQLGTQTLNITYLDHTLPITVTVSERPEYLEALAQKIENFAVVLDGSNVAAFLELKRQYDDLSPYEAASMNAALTEKYENLLNQYDTYIAPELGQTELLLSQTMQKPVLNIWGNSIEGSGTWIQTNSLLYQAQRAYNKSLVGWKTPDVYGSLTGVSADMAVYSDNMQSGVAINVGSSGYYYACVDNNTVDSAGNRKYVLQLHRKDVQTDAVVADVSLSEYGITLAHGTWFNLLITLEENTIRVYLDGQLLISYEEANQLFDLGEAGLRIYRGDALVDNVRVYGVLQDKAPDSSELIQSTSYADNFEDETVGANPSHWVENYTSTVTTDNWKIYNEGTKVYGTKADGYTQTYLYAFDHNPTITSKFMVSELGDEFGFITRMAPSTAFVLVGYDAQQSKWFVKSQVSEAGGAEITYQEGTFLLEQNRWYDAQLVLSNRNLTLHIDGENVLMLDTVQHIGYGRVGFYTQDTSFFVDDYTVTMATGDIPQDGVVSYVIDEDTANNMFEIETFDDGKNLLGVGEASKFVSNDAGLTWTEVTNNSTYAQVIASNYTTLLKMSNGKYLQILMNDGMKVQTSGDLLKWTTISNMVSADEYKNSSGSLVTLVHVNTATEIKLKNGGSRIFVPVAFRKYQDGTKLLGHYTQVYYSDDFGYTWQKSANNTLDVLPGATEADTTSWAESKVIQCADGSLRMYYSRNKLGCMQYTVSYDSGITWEGLYQVPEIQLPMTSYAIMEDPTHTGTFYMVCCIGTPAVLGDITPRTRFVLLKSTDGMNWEFLMNLERMSEYLSEQNGVSLYQILDPSLLITEDYVYVTMGRSEREFSEHDSGSHQQQRVYYVRIEKDKLSGREWDASSVANMYYPKTVVFADMPKTEFTLGESFVCEGTVKLIDFLGNETVLPLADVCTIYSVPNMYAAGTQTVHLRYINGADLSYQVQITDPYTQSNLLFVENFDDGLRQNWSGSLSEWTLDTQRGGMVAPTSTSRILVNASSYKKFGNYVFETQITLPEDVSNSTQLGGICFGIQDSGSVVSRYEYTVTYKDGGWCPRVYKRVSNVSGYSSITCAGNHQTVNSKVSITPGVPFVMKVALDGLNMKCYIDDVLVFDYTITSTKDAATKDGAILGGVGLIGFKATSALFDNVKMYRQSPIGYREYFENTGANNLNGKGWLTDGTSYSSAAYRSEFWKTDGEENDQHLVVLNRNYSLLYNTGIHNSNYVFEAEMQYENAIVSTNGSQTEATAANNGHAGIVFGVNTQTGLGYEFCLIYQGDTWKCRLYNRADTSINITKALPDGVTFDENTAVTLRAVLDGATVNCYVNGNLVISHTRSDGKTISGNAGLISRLGGPSSQNDLVTYFDDVLFLHNPGAQIMKNGIVVDAYATQAEAEAAMQSMNYGGTVSINLLDNTPNTTSYKVSYVADGTTVKEIMVEHGGSVLDAPAVPEKAGHTGVWDDIGTNITSDTQINAVYTVVTAIAQWNITLGDKIGANFYVAIDDKNVADTVVKITVNHETVTHNPMALVDGKYLFTVDLAAAQMTDVILVEIVCGETVIQKSYSIRQYADYILDDTNGYDDVTRALVKEMLNYGAAAQIYFDYNAENLADTGIEGTGLAALPETAETDLSVSGSVTGVRYYGSSLIFDSKTAVRFYFTGDITGCTFTVGNVQYVPQEKNGLWYVEIADINPQDLNKAITLRVNDALSVTYSPMNYIVRMRDSNNSNLVALLHAMYNYHLAAVVYGQKTTS